MGLPICATTGEAYRQNPLTGAQLTRDPVTHQTSLAGVRPTDVPPGQLGGSTGGDSLTGAGLSAAASVGSVVPPSVLGAYK